MAGIFAPKRGGGSPISGMTLFLLCLLVIQSTVMMLVLLRQRIPSEPNVVSASKPPAAVAAAVEEEQQQKVTRGEAAVSSPSITAVSPTTAAARGLEELPYAAQPCSAGCVHPAAPVGVGLPSSSGEAAIDDVVRRRFTDMMCYLYGDETELCVFDNVICYDGTHVVTSVPAMPPASKLDPDGLGIVLGDPTGGCFDYRYYEPSSLEYTNCKYDIFKFARELRYPNGPRVYSVSVTPVGTPVPHAADVAGGGNAWDRAEAGITSQARAAAVAAAHTPISATPRPLAALWPLPLAHRRWGPYNRGSIRFREVTDEQILGRLGPRGSYAVNSEHGGVAVLDPVAVARAAAAPSSAVPKGTFYAGFRAESDPTLRMLTSAGVGIESVTKAEGSNLTVYWADGALWFTAMDAQFDRHIYHASTRFLSLYHAQRQNATTFGDNDGDGFLPPLSDRNHPIESTFYKTHRTPWTAEEAVELDARFLEGLRGGGGSGGGAGVQPQQQQQQQQQQKAARVVRSNRIGFRTSGGWDLPPQDYVVLAGGNQVPPSQMIAFLKGMSELTLQQGGRYVSTGAISSEAARKGLQPASSLLCARRGAVTGTHPRLFVNRADAWLFRKRAYDFAGAPALRLLPHPHHPPRTITILIRPKKSGRNLENEAEILAVLNATGLPVNVVYDMGSLSFKEQILAMAGTGILVAAHGAALVNAMFLPQHAVVIEVFPWQLKKMTYYSLSSLMGLWYLPVYTGRPNLTDMTHYGVRNVYANSSTGQNFLDGCVAMNMSSVDSLLHHRCNSVSKHLPIALNPERLRETLWEAIDIIAAYSVLNDAWKPQLDVLQGRVSPSATGTKTRKPASRTRSRTPTPQVPD